LKNEAKISNSSSYRDSKRSTLGPQSVTEIKAILETQIANREYQLVNALIKQAERKQMNSWDEITKRLAKVLQIDIVHKKNSSRIIKIHLLISNAFLGFVIFSHDYIPKIYFFMLEIGDFKKSLQHIISAEEKLRVCFLFQKLIIIFSLCLFKEYANRFNQGILSKREIPPDILSQKVFLQKFCI